MVGDFILSLEPYLTTIYIIHIVISLVLAFILSFITMKRFTRKTKEIEMNDARRLEEILNENIVFRILFRVSLHKNNRITNFMFMFLFNFSMPFVGYFFSAWISLYLKNIKYDKVVLNTNILNLDEFGMSFLKVERIFGEGSMMDLMNSEYAPKSKKLKALSSLANNASPANLKIIRQTLSSSDDEIRMFGYAIINKAEKSLNVKINHQLERYNESKAFVSKLENDEDIKIYGSEEKNRVELADSARELAFLYWELVYTELSHESLKDDFLKEVIKYIGEAKKYYNPEIRRIEDMILENENNSYIDESSADRLEMQKQLEYEKEKLRNYSDISTKLYILMGRVYMAKHEYEKASTEFTIAQELHSAYSSFILPYLAEIHFKEGNYRVVNSIMTQAQDLGVNATLYPIIEQWKVS